MLGECGAEDVLLAYPLIGPRMDRFLYVLEKFPETRFSCLTDYLIPATQIAEKAVKRKMIVSVYVDINSGMNRTGLLPDQTAVELVKTIVEVPVLQFEGLHVYDGDIGQKNLGERRVVCIRDFLQVEELKVRLEVEGVEGRIVVGESVTYYLIERIIV